MMLRSRKLKVVLIAASVVLAWHIHALGLLGARFEPDDATDRAVVLAALEHFAQQEESNCYASDEGQTIYLQMETLGNGGDRIPRTWHGWPLIWQLHESVKARNSDSEELSWSGSANVRIKEVPKFLQMYPDYPSDFRCWAVTGKPGYSRRGQMAVVTLAFGPTSHGANVVYMLERVGSSWSVVTLECWWYV